MSSPAGKAFVLGIPQMLADLQRALAAETSELGVAAVVGLIVVNTIFFPIMKAPTILGRRLMDHIDGFRHYLTVAEQDRLNFHNPPELTPQRFEAYLPYAMALDVAVAWSQQFDQAATRAARDRGESWSFGDYTPSWYGGGGGRWSWGDLTGTLDNTIATAATAPGQTSGLVGDIAGSVIGGVVGGGGGGGGGGGW
jgi:hypothetical protein